MFSAWFHAVGHAGFLWVFQLAMNRCLSHSVPSFPLSSLKSPFSSRTFHRCMEVTYCMVRQPVCWWWLQHRPANASCLPSHMNFKVQIAPVGRGSDLFWLIPQKYYSQSLSELHQYNAAAESLPTMYYTNVVGHKLKLRYQPINVRECHVWYTDYAFCDVSYSVI